MEGSLLGRVLVAILILHLSTYISSSAATRPLPRDTDTDYLKTSCNVTLYPKLCYNSLSSYANKIKSNPKVLVDTALNVTLRATESTSKLIMNLSKLRGLNPRVAAALRDCVEEVGDSVYELQSSIGEMGRAKGPIFGVVKSDIQTWVSAALTDDDTCTDGLDEGGAMAVNRDVKTIVRRRILKIAHLTSNALAIVNHCA